MSTQKGSTSRSSVVIERTYRTRVEELWGLWTTKEGFESWWGSEGSRVEVHTIEAREGGTLHYDMIAVAPAQIAEMKQLGLATSTSVHARFTELKPHRRLILTHVIDFVPGVKPYEQTIAVDFFPAGDTVRMVTTIEPMHNEEFTQTSIRVFTSQLEMLEGRFQGMRKVIFAINITIDGCCDHTKVDGNDEVLEYFAHLLRDVDLLVFGRKTYQLMVPFWPDIAKNHSGQTQAMNEFARAFDSIDKIVVFSQSLVRAEGKNTRIVRTKPRDAILELKQERGKNILLSGVDIHSQLIELGLVDEYHFVVHPIVAGEGRRLLEGISLQERLQLKLVESTSFKSGCVALRYLKQ